MGKRLLKIPNKIAPVVFARMNNSIEIGAIKSLSNDRDFLSKVMVTASIDVVPKIIDRAIIPGKDAAIFKVPFVLRNIISIQAKGKSIPQLMLGGFK